MSISELHKACRAVAESAIGLLRKSQMSFDFTGANPHHVAYDRVNQRGTVSHIQAKGQQHVHEMTRDEFDKWVGRKSPSDIIGEIMQQKHQGKTAKEIADYYTKKYRLTKPINLVEFKTLKDWHDHLQKIGAKRDPLNGHGGGFHSPSDSYHNIVMVRDGQSDSNYLGTLRHEIEHAIDRDKGWEPSIYNTHQENIDSGKFQKLGNDAIISRVKRGTNQSIGDILREPYKGHHQHYDYFELDYPRRSMVKQAIKEGKIVPEHVKESLGLQNHVTPQPSVKQEETTMHTTPVYHENRNSNNYRNEKAAQKRIEEMGGNDPDSPYEYSTSQGENGTVYLWSGLKPKSTKPTIDKMAQLIKDNNYDFNSFEHHYGTCDACGKKKDVRTIHDADDAGGTMYGDACDDCIETSHRKAYMTKDSEAARFWQDVKFLDLGAYSNLREDMTMNAWDNASDVPLENKYDVAMAYFDRIHDPDYMQEMYGDKIK